MNRKLFICIAVLCIGLSMQAAKAQSHIEFKGIPIDGPFSEFIEKLKKEGFTLEKLEPHIATMSGKFVNLDCEVYVFASPKTKITQKVVLYAPKDENWMSLKNSYNRFKQQYTTKYGAPKHEIEGFLDPYYEGDGYETQALRKKKCYYVTSWALQEGTVGVEISEFCQIKFIYEDEINSEIAKQEREAEVLNEI